MNPSYCECFISSAASHVPDALFTAHQAALIKPESNLKRSCFEQELISKPTAAWRTSNFPVTFVTGRRSRGPRAAASERLNIDRVFYHISLNMIYDGSRFKETRTRNSELFCFVLQPFYDATLKGRGLEIGKLRPYPEVVFIFKVEARQIEKSPRCRWEMPGCQWYRFSTWMQVDLGHGTLFMARVRHKGHADCSSLSACRFTAMPRSLQAVDTEPEE